MRYRKFLPQVDQNIHQLPQDLPQAFGFGDIRHHDSINGKKINGHDWIMNKRVMTKKNFDEQISIYSDDSLIRTHLFPVDISGLTSFPDY